MFDTPLKQQEPRFTYLLVGLLVYLIGGPIAREFLGQADGLILGSALSAVLVVGIFSLQENLVLFVLGGLLAIVSIVLNIVGYFQADNPALQLILMADVLIFYGMSIYLAVQHLFRRGPVTMNRLTGGICIYLMLGMVWSILYMYLIWLQPDAFAGAIHDTDDNPLYWDMTYFSFVTLTTLGYGDITPVDPMARGLAYMEAIAGQLYVAMLIGSLVGAFAGRNTDS